MYILNRNRNLFLADGGMMANGGRVLVGKFDEQQLRNKEDKKAVEKAQKETGLKYIDSKIVKKGGKMMLEVYLISDEEYYNSSKFADGGMMMARGGEVRYKLKGNNFGDQIENGRKFKVLIEKAFNNQSGETRYPLNFISETAFTGKIVKHDGKNYLKDYSYKGTLSKFDFLDDKDFIEALKYVDRPAIRKFEDGGMADAPEIEILNNDGRLKVYYIKGNIGFDGTLRKYHSGRDFEYEFEPDNFDDEESEDFYYNDGDNVIENEILDYFYANFDKMEDGGMMARGGEVRMLNDYIKDLQKTIEDKEEFRNELNSDLSDFEKDMLENRLNDLRIKEDYLYGQIQFLLKNYLIKNGKPFTVSKKTHEFLQSQGFAKGGKVNYEYIPKYEIESINTWDGENIEERDILDGAYVKRKRKR
jgi:hypothetical protein